MHYLHLKKKDIVREFELLSYGGNLTIKVGLFLTYYAVFTATTVYLKG